MGSVVSLLVASFKKVPHASTDRIDAEFIPDRMHLLAYQSEASSMSQWDGHTNSSLPCPLSISVEAPLLSTFWMLFDAKISYKWWLLLLNAQR